MRLSFEIPENDKNYYNKTKKIDKEELLDFDYFEPDYVETANAEDNSQKSISRKLSKTSNDEQIVQLTNLLDSSI